MAAEPVLSFDDVQILKLESAAIRGHTCKLIVIEPDAEGRPVSAELLRKRIGERLSAVPRLRQRVAMPRLGRPRWEQDPDFDLARHVAPVPLEGTLGERALRERVGELMAQRLDHERPLWRLDLLPLEAGSTAVVGRIHHCMADGVSAMRILSSVLWDSDPPNERARRPRAAAKSQRGQGGARVGIAGSSAEGGRPGMLRALREITGALRRELRPGAETPLDRQIGPTREVAWTAFPLESLKRTEHAAGEGVTVNDVILAAVTGALRRWFEETGARPEDIKAQIPVSLHTRGEGGGEIGNLDSFLFVDLPLTEPDPIERLRRINAETQERKHDHDAETLYCFFHSLSHFRPLYAGVTRLTSGPREFALSVSNVPGPRGPVSVLGRSLRRFCSFAEPADRHALRVAVVSLGGEVAFGLCSDPEAVPALDRIADSLGDSLRALDPGP